MSRKPINLIDPHASHPGKDRAVEMAGKIKLPDCEELAKWIETALAQFMTGMPDENRKYWNKDKADYVPRGIEVENMPTPPGASSMPSMGSSSPTRRFLERMDTPSEVRWRRR